MPKGVFVRTPEHLRKMSEGIKLAHQKKGNGYKIGWHHSKESIEKIRLSSQGRRHMAGKIGENANHWKGERAGYHAFHRWVESRKGKPKYCEKCGIINKNKKYEWANKDHKYTRNLDDYIRMCTQCHRTYDKNRGVKMGRNKKL